MYGSCGVVATLRNERAELVDTVIETVNAVKPKDLALLFPADHPDRRAHELEESWRSRRNADLDAELDKDAAEAAADAADEPGN